MTEYELMDLFYVNNEAITTLIMNFVSILSGYLVASHYMARHITTAQFFIMAAAYSIIMLMTIYALNERINESILIVSLLQEKDGLFKLSFEQERDFFIFFAAFILSFFGSIYFAFKSRAKPKNET